MHLRNAPTGLMKSMGYGKGYKYAHDYPPREISDFAGTPGTGAADVAKEFQQVHLPEKLKGRKVYRPNPRDKNQAK
jgi:putative ATPase